MLQSTSDSSSFELADIRLRLKSGLRFHLSGVGPSFRCTIEDASRGLYFRIGLAEYTWITMLDGTSSLASTLRRTCCRLGPMALSESDAVRISRWLIESELAWSTTRTRRSTGTIPVTAASGGTGVVTGDAPAEPSSIESTRRAKENNWLNPISWRVSFGNPDRWLERCTQAINRVFCWPVGMICLIVMLVGFYSVLDQWSRLGQPCVNLLSAQNWIWFGSTWLLLKLFHELGHALTCRRFGGRVTDWGVVFLLLIPLPYVDVTSCWRLPQKWQRLWVSAAGMTAELFVASVAAIVWARTEVGMLQQHAFRVMCAASINTLVFNANPLMRFDGYYLLCDLLDLPGLGGYGQQWIRSVLRQWFFKLPPSPLPISGWRYWFIRVYGVLSVMWKMGMSATLLLAAVSIFPGVGPVLALMGFTAWFVRPVLGLVQYLYWGTPFEQPDRRRFAWTAGGLALTLVGLGWCLPAPSILSAPGVVMYDGLHPIRVQSAGFVQQVHVVSEQWVCVGEELITLSNPELTQQYAAVERRIDQARLEANSHQVQGYLAAYQSMLATIRGLEAQRDELRQGVERLVLKATREGRIVSAHPEAWIGQFVQPGIELLAIADPSQKRVIASARQQDYHDLSRFQGDRVAFQPIGGRTISGQLNMLLPQASARLPHPGLGSPYGGPLDVAPREELEQHPFAESDVPGDDEETLTLLQPRLELEVGLDPATSRTMFVGQIGTVRVRGREARLAKFLADSLGNWVRAGLSGVGSRHRLQ